MLDYVLDSLVMNGQMAVYIIECKSGNFVDYSAMAIAKGFWMRVKVVFSS